MQLSLLNLSRQILPTYNRIMYFFLFKRTRFLGLVFQSFKRATLNAKIKTQFCCNNQLSGVSFSTKQFPMDKISSLKEDVLLYSLEKTSFIRNLQIFGISQFVVCFCLGFNVLFTLTDTRPQGDSNSIKSFNFGDFKYRLTAGIGCFIIGVITAVVSYILPSRIIKHLTLCKGGNLASIVTYGPFGKTTKMEVPLRHLSCMVSREQAKSYLPLKMKNRWMFFLIDSKGHFYQPALFDVSVGTKNW